MAFETSVENDEIGPATFHQTTLDDVAEVVADQSRRRRFLVVVRAWTVRAEIRFKIIDLFLC